MSAVLEIGVINFVALCLANSAMIVDGVIELAYESSMGSMEEVQRRWDMFDKIGVAIGLTSATHVIPGGTSYLCFHSLGGTSVTWNA